MLAAFFLGLFEWPLPQAPRFVGLKYLGELANDPLFLKTLANSAYFALGSVPLAVGLGLLLALLLEQDLPGARLFRIIFLLPAAVSGVATALAWGWVFNGRFGLINSLLSEAGLTGPNWLQSETWAMPVMILVQLWIAGINMIVYLAALRGIPPDLTEAALIDGASRWQRVRHITLPLLSPVTFYLVLVNLIGAFQVFTPIYILTRGGPNNATLTLPLYIYQTAFAWGNLGYASMLAVALFLLVLALTAILLRTMEARVFYLGRGAG